MNLTILKDNTVEYDIKIKDVLESLSRTPSLPALNIKLSIILDSDAHICIGVSCIRCPFIDDITRCERGSS